MQRRLQAEELTGGFVWYKHDGTKVTAMSANDWASAETVEEATIAFLQFFESPSPSEAKASYQKRIKSAEEYAEMLKQLATGGTFQYLYGSPVTATFTAGNGRTHIILQQTSSYLSGKCNRAACISIASGFTSSGETTSDLYNYMMNHYDGAIYGAVPSNSAYWSHYGLKVTEYYSGVGTNYTDKLQTQLTTGGYALLWLNNGGTYSGKSGTVWTSLYHWIAILGIKIEDDQIKIAVSDSGRGNSGWYNIDEFTKYGVTYMVFVNPI